MQVMAISVILISSDSSEESVGTSTARVILFGTIPTTVPATASTADLPVTHDDTPLIPTNTPTILPIVPIISSIAPTIQYTSPFILTDSSDSDTSKRPLSQDPYEVTTARWRSRVAVRSSPPSPPVRQPIPNGRAYHTQPNGVLKMLTAGKRVGPLPTRRLALRYLEDYSSSDHFTSDDSSRDSLSDSSSKTLSDSSCDSPTTISARPSRKRRRSPTTSVPAALLVPRALSLVRADLLSPCKRIRDSDFMNDFKADIDTCIVFVDDIAARGMDVRVEDGTAAKEEVKSSARGMIKIKVDRVTHLVVSDNTAEPIKEDYPDLVSTDGSLEVMQRGLDVIMQELYDHMSAAMLKRIGTLERDNMRLKGMLDVERQRVDHLRRKALEEYDAARNPRTDTKIEDEQQDDNVKVNGNNGNGNGNGKGNPNVNNEGVVPVTREFTYQDFVKYQPLNFKGIEGVVGLTRWFEKMEMVFHVSNFPTKYQVKYATCTLLNSELT
ncbi:hypothetical protein Tco_0519899 [Tanacetum coccineum]